MADETREDETMDEVTEAAETGSTPEEAHREGEFDDLRDRLEALSARAEEILKAVTGVREAMGSFVEAGATVREEPDGDAEEEIEEIDLDTPIEEMDFDLDDED